MWAHGDAYQSNPETVETMMDIVHGYIFDIVSRHLGDTWARSKPEHWIR